MKVFLAGIIQGSLVEPTIHSQDWREPIKAILTEHLPEAEVYCHYSRHPNSIAYDLSQIRQTLAEGNRLASQCDLLLAYVPEASMGTAIEMHEACAHGAAVVTICPLQANWVVRAYSDRLLPDIAAFDAFAASGELHALLEAKRAL
ncbi:MAG: hypothetical protein ACYS8X_02300 [Planctomycetota bacterium]|jgi:hypothetical protein